MLVTIVLDSYKQRKHLCTKIYWILKTQGCIYILLYFFLIFRKKNNSFLNINKRQLFIYLLLTIYTASIREKRSELNRKGRYKKEDNLSDFCIKGEQGGEKKLCQ